MKFLKSNSSLFKHVVAAALLAAGCALPVQAVNVSVSGTSLTLDQPLVDFLNNNFQNVTLTYGNYSDPANIPVGTDLFVIGRNLSSTPYANSANSATFNALTIPVVAFTSYVTRPDSGRWGWHDAGVNTTGQTVDGDEITVTAAGASVFGVAVGTYDWFTAPAPGNFFATGNGSVGDGDILATLGGQILAVGWNTGDQSGTGATFGGNRLLFNLPQNVPNNNTVILPSTAAGQQALINVLSAYTPLIPVPEPGTMALAAFGGGLAMLLAHRRRNG